MSYVGNDRFPGLSGGIIPKAFIPDKVKKRSFPENFERKIPKNTNGRGVYQDSGNESRKTALIKKGQSI